MGYLVKVGNHKFEVVKPTSFDKEEKLQEIVKCYPEIIPLEEIDEDFEPLLIVGREFALENVGSIDLLAIDVNGLITILEFKLEKSTDIRKVVAQVVEYAANIWEMSYDVLDNKVQIYFKSDRCEIPDLKNKTLVQAVRWHFDKIKKDEGVAFSSEDFIKNVSSNLQKGEFRLLIFCDNVDERTKRSVEYLNLLSRFDIYCVSTDAYEVDGNTFFKSTLITRDRKKSSSVSKYAGKISFDDFINSVPMEYKDVYIYFADLVKKHNGFYSMGTKGFATYFNIGEDKIRLFAGYPEYIELISSKYVEKYVNKEKIVVHDDALKDFEKKIETIEPIKSSFKSKGIYPIYKYLKIKPEELKRYFDIIIDWYSTWFEKD